MKIRAALAGLVSGLILGALTVGPASAMIRIHEDYGGQIGQYIRKFQAWRDSGQQVVIDGECYSACTLVLAVVPHNRICITSRARLGFHAAWMPDEYGRPRRHSGGTHLLYAMYPRNVQNWISRHGGLRNRMIVMTARELATFLPVCSWS